MAETSNYSFHIPTLSEPANIAVIGEVVKDIDEALKEVHDEAMDAIGSFDSPSNNIYVKKLNFLGADETVYFAAKCLNLDGILETDFADILLSGNIKIKENLIKPVTDLDSVTESGIYSCTEYNTENLIFTTKYPSPNTWIVQYRFTANNIERRFRDCSSDDNDWTAWSSISDCHGYDPTTTYIASSKTIQQGLADANKNGIRIGDVLNGDYIGVSSYDMALMHDNLLKERSAEPILSYDLTDSTALTDDKSSDSVVELSSAQYDNSKKCWYGGGTLKIKLDKLLTEYFVKIKINASYNQQFNITAEPASQYDDHKFYPSTSAAKTQTFFVKTGLAHSRTLTITLNNWTWIDGIEIYTVDDSNLGFDSSEMTGNPSVTKITFKINIAGDSAALLNAINLLPDGASLSIPSGYYNVGSCDRSDNTGVLRLTQDNVTIIGDGRDKTIITGYYTTGSIVKSLLKVSGKQCTLKNLSFVTGFIDTRGTGQAPTINDDGTETAWDGVGIIGGQDTLVIGSTTSNIFHDCYIEGTVDFICGGGSDRASIFDLCTLALKGRAVGGVICAPSSNALMYFDTCVISDNGSYEFGSQNEKYSLGRPWGSNSKLYFEYTQFNIKPGTAYTTMTEGVNFADYGDESGVDINGDSIDDYHTPNNIPIPSNLSDYYTDYADAATRAGVE